MEITQESYNISKDTLYIDDPYYRQLDNQGNLSHLKNSDALAQAFKLWVTSGLSEKVRSNTGGVLVPHLGKAMTQNRANKIKNDILLSLNKDFTPSLIVTNLNVVPDVKRNRWVIHIEGYSKALTVGLNTYVLVNNNATLS